MKKIPLLAAFLALLLAAPDAARTEAKPPSEYFVKAVYLFNFIKFIEWPGQYALSQRGEANVCIAGKDPFGAELQYIEKASTDKLKLKILRGVSDDQMKECHMLFISTSEEGRLGDILAQLRALPVVTVSEIPGFADRGGMIGFVNVEKNIGLFSKEQIRLEINKKAASGVNLRVDANLLEIAKRVIN